MKCCPSCFGNRGLRVEISFRSTETGTCNYCGSKDETLIEARDLSDKFHTLLDAYQPDDAGKSLVLCLKEDWGLFPTMDDAHAKELLGDVLNDGEIVRKTFAPPKQEGPDPLSRWEELRKELMHENRFFPKTQIDLDRLARLLTALELDAKEIPAVWFRARIQTGDAAFSKEEMLAPSPKIASHGRANPAGIPYLYLASDAVTAVSEIRPHTGDTVCVAPFAVGANLSLVDLRDARRTVSPFALADLLSDEADANQMRIEMAFLQRLGDELTQPVLPLASAFEYTPSQYLCEYIKKCGYDGVIYRSSVVNNGMNLALFKPEKATVGDVQQRKVKRVSIEVA